MGRLRSVGLLLLLTLIAPSAYANFPDVPGTYPYAEAVQYAVSKGFVHGYPDRLFRPNVVVTRAEFVKIIALAIYPQSDIDRCVKDVLPEGKRFPDVAYDLWYGPYVCITQMTNLIGGYPDGTFKPEERISLVEAAKIYSLAYGLSRIALPNLGADNTLWYGPYILMMEAVRAIPSSVVGLTHFVTRGEVAEMLFRLEKAAAGETDILTPHRTLEDLTEEQEWIDYQNDTYGFSFRYPAEWPAPHALPRGINDDIIPFAKSVWTLYLGTLRHCAGKNECVERDLSINVYPSTVKDSYAAQLRSNSGITVLDQKYYRDYSVAVYNEPGRTCTWRHAVFVGIDHVIRFSAACAIENETTRRGWELLMESMYLWSKEGQR